MSNSVTTAIRGSVRDMAIGKTKTTEKADRATVEQVRVGLILFSYAMNCVCVFILAVTLLCSSIGDLEVGSVINYATICVLG